MVGRLDVSIRVLRYQLCMRSWYGVFLSESCPWVYISLVTVYVMVVLVDTISHAMLEFE